MTTAINATDPGRPQADEHGVYYRRGRRLPWRLMTHAGTRDQAVRLMYDLTTSNPSGDWCVRPTTDPPTKTRHR